MNPTLLATLLCLGVTICGVGWLRLLPFKTDCAVETLAWGFVLGSVWLTALRLLAIVVPLVASPLVVWVLLLAPTLSVVRHKQILAVPRRWLGFVPTLVVVCVCLWFAAQKPTWNIDALRRWALHAKWTSIEKTLLPATVQDAAWASTHPSYPPLVPSLLSFGIDNGADADVGLRPFMPFYFLALLGVIYGFISRRDPRLATVMTLAFACTPAFFWKSQTGLGADAVLADIPLALFVCAAASAILWVHEGHRDAWILAAIAAAGAALCKQEGLPICAALFLVGVIVASVKRMGRSRVLALLSALGVLLASSLCWQFLARSMPIMEGEDYLSGKSIGDLFTQFDRLPTILVRLGSEMFRIDLWGPLWLIGILALMVTLLSKWIWRKESRPQHGVTIMLFALAGQGVVVLAYLVSGWQNGNYEMLMETSLTRLLIHTSPLIALWSACLLPNSEIPNAAANPTANTP